MSHAEEYIRKLSHLSGDDFENEVVVAFQKTHHGFQRIPRKPGGDGGLDGLSHGLTIAYCCYGLERIAGPSTTPAKLRRKIVKKFKADLMRLMELEFKARKICPKPNKVLKGILGSPPRTKLSGIKLIVSWFEDNRLIGDLQKVYVSLRKKGDCRFLSDDCELVIWGPRDVGTNITITQETLARVEHPALFSAIEQAKIAAEHHEPTEQTGFDAKFDDLALRLPGKPQIEELREHFRVGWSKSLLLEEKLSTDLPYLHRQFDAARGAAGFDALLASADPSKAPTEIISASRDGFRTRMSKLLSGGLPASLSEELAEAETGRLIGECQLDWRDFGDD